MHPAGPLAAAPVSARARRLLEALYAQYARGLADPLKLTLVSLERELFGHAERARNSQVQADLYAEMQRLRERGERSAPRFLEALAQELGNLCEPRHTPAVGETGNNQAFHALTLVETPRSTATSCQTRSPGAKASRCNTALQLLGQRFGVLAAAPAFEPEHVPLGPYAACRVLREAGDVLGLSLDSQLMLYRVFERQALDRYLELIERANILLAHEGVLPGLVYLPYLGRTCTNPRRGARAPAQERAAETADSGTLANSGRDRPAAVEPATLTSWTGQAPQAAWGAAMRCPSALPQAHASQTGTPAGEPQPGDSAPISANDDRFAPALSSLQQMLGVARQQPGFGPAGGRCAGDVPLTSGHPGAADGPAQRVGRDAIARNWSRKRLARPPQRRRRAAGAAQPVARRTRAARQASRRRTPTPSTCSACSTTRSTAKSVAAPRPPSCWCGCRCRWCARRCRTRRSSCATSTRRANCPMPWPNPGRLAQPRKTPSAAAAAEARRRLVDEVVTDYQGDEAVFEAANREIQAHYRSQARKAEIAERRHIEAARGKERLEMAKRLAGDSIEYICTEHAPPRFVQTLLKQAWSDMLLLALLRQGEQSEEWAERQQATDRTSAGHYCLPAGGPAGYSTGQRGGRCHAQSGVPPRRGRRDRPPPVHPPGEDDVPSRTELTAKLEGPQPQHNRRGWQKPGPMLANSRTRPPECEWRKKPPPPRAARPPLAGLDPIVDLERAARAGRGIPGSARDHWRTSAVRQSTPGKEDRRAIAGKSWHAG